MAGSYGSQVGPALSSLNTGPAGGVVPTGGLGPQGSLDMYYADQNQIFALLSGQVRGTTLSGQVRGTTHR